MYARFKLHKVLMNLKLFFLSQKKKKKEEAILIAWFELYSRSNEKLYTIIHHITQYCYNNKSKSSFLKVFHNLAYFLRASPAFLEFSGTGRSEIRVTLEDDMRTPFSMVEGSIFHNLTSHTWSQNLYHLKLFRKDEIV